MPRVLPRRLAIFVRGQIGLLSSAPILACGIRDNLSLCNNHHRIVDRRALKESQRSKTNS
jgi:hypothetical protein